MKIAAVSKLALRFAPTKRLIVALPVYRSDTPAKASAADASQEWEYVAFRIPFVDGLRVQRTRPLKKGRQKGRMAATGFVILRAGG